MTTGFSSVAQATSTQSSVVASVLNLLRPHVSVDIDSSSRKTHPAKATVSVEKTQEPPLRCFELFDTLTRALNVETLPAACGPDFLTPNPRPRLRPRSAGPTRFFCGRLSHRRLHFI